MAQIITRQEAMILGLMHYETGKPCRNGHLSYRYTTSGTCAACLAETRSNQAASRPPRPRADNGPDIAAFKERQTQMEEALSNLVLTKELVHDKDIRTVFDTAVALCVAEYPVLAEHKFKMPMMGGIPIRPFRVPIKHIQMLRDVVNVLWAPKPPDLTKVNAYRDQLIKEQESPIPDWADKP